MFASLLLLVCGVVRTPTTESIPLAVAQGQCSAVLEVREDEQYLLIVGSLAQDTRSRQVRLRWHPTTEAVCLPRAEQQNSAGWRRELHRLQEQQARRHSTWTVDFPPGAQPPRERTFHLYTRGDDLSSAHNYTAVTAELRAVSDHCQVYVERGCHPSHLDATIRDAVAVFERDIFPRSRQWLGRCLDVDRDGRFTLFFTPWLGRLPGNVQVSGYVRGSDLYRDLAPPFSNRCDMMYLNSDLRAGPHLRSVLAHEHAHAIIFSEHVFASCLPPEQRQDEESWLNEGLCHVVEDFQGFGWTNLDHRVAAFLKAPECCPLVLADYYRAGLWRTPGVRGAAYLFLRWCVQRHGEDLVTRLVRSNLHGVRNLEGATKEPFADLFRGWTVALALSGWTGAVPGVEPLRRPVLRGELGRFLLCGPLLAAIPPGGTEHTVRLVGTAASYLRLLSPGGKRGKLEVEAPEDTKLQVTLLRLSGGPGELSVNWLPEVSGRQGRVQVTAQRSTVRLLAVALEPRQTPANQEPALAAPDFSAASWFATLDLRAGQSVTSRARACPGHQGGEWVVKVLAVDPLGRRLAGWAVIPRH